MERLAGTVRTVILIMFMQHHTEVTVQMCLGQTAGKSFVGIEHLLHAGEGIDIQYPGTQLVERQMNARDTRNTIPVETGLLPATGGKSNHFIGFSGKNLHAAMCQITAIEVGGEIVLGSPEVTGMSAYYGSPVAATLYGYTTVTQSQIALRVGFRTEALGFKQLLHLQFVASGSLRQIVGRILVRSFCIGNQAQIGSSHFGVILLLAIRRTGNGHRGILDRYQASSPVGMASGHGERPLLQVAIETHGEKHFLHRLVCLLGQAELGTTQQVNHISGTVQTAHCIGRIIVAMMEAGTVRLERTGQSRRRKTAFVQPTGEGTQVLQFLRGILHNQNAGYAALQLGVERIYINTVDGRFGIYLIGDGIPVERTYRLFQLTCLTQHVLHQEISHKQTAHTISVMVDIPPATAVGNTLVGGVIVHGDEFLLQLVFQRRILRIVVGDGDAFHQVEIVAYLYPQSGEHIFVPIGYHTFVCLGVTYEIDRTSCHLAVLVGNPIKIILLTDGLHLLVRKCGRRVEHVAETLLHNPYILLLRLGHVCQRDVRFPQGVFVDNQPVVGGSLIYKRYLQVGSLLAGIHLAGSNQMVEKEFPLHVGGYNSDFVHPFFRGTLHIAFITYPCSAPTGKVDAKRKRGAYLAILQELKQNLLVLGLLIVHPYDESRKIGVFPRRVFLLKFQVFFDRQCGTRLESPAQTVVAVPIMFVANAQLRTGCRSDKRRNLLLLKRKQALILHDLCVYTARQQHANERYRSYFPFTELHHVCLFKVIDICYLEICKTYVVLPQP